MIETYANILLGVVVLTIFATLGVIWWMEARESRNTLEYYKGWQWEKDEGGEP
jgi:hypothetical protein